MNVRGSTRPAGGMARYVPALAWLPGYQARWLPRDLVAGVVVWAILIPEGVAYAQVAGLPATALFYAAPWALLAYAVLGPSRRLVVAVSGAAAALSAATVAPLAAAGSPQYAKLTAALALLAGLFSIAFGLLRLGFVSNFLSRPVTVGFIFGLAANIAIKQLPKLFGVEAGDGGFFERLADLVRQRPDTQVATLLLGLVVLAVLVVLERAAPRIPAPLVALVLAIAVVSLLNLDQHGVKVVGHLEGGITPPALPLVGWHDLGGLALVVYAEGLGAADAIATRHGEPVRPNQELLGFGAANAAAGLFQGFPIGVSLSKSAANDEAGAHSQVSGLVAAALTLVTAFALTGLFTNLPETALAAIVIFAIRGMFDLGALARFRRLRPVEFRLALVALFGVLVLETLPGLVLAVGLSLLVLAFRASRPQVRVLGRSATDGRFADLGRQPDAATVDGVLVVRVEGGLWYANAQLVADRLAALEERSDPPCRVVVLDLEETPEFDITSLERLRQLAEREHRAGRALLLARVHGTTVDQLRADGLLASIDGLFPTVEAAVDHATRITRPG